MKPHKHAEVLRAIADGVPLSEFEYSRNKVYWDSIRECQIRILDDNDTYIRRKPQYIMVNGFKVPKPLMIRPRKDALYYLSSTERKPFHEGFLWSNSIDEQMWLDRGLVHSEPEAAIAHAKAMLGIDPEAE